MTSFKRCLWSGMARDDATHLGFGYLVVNGKETIECGCCGKRVALRASLGNKGLTMLPTHNRKEAA